jgi:hypothetical protein
MAPICHGLTKNSGQWSVARDQKQAIWRILGGGFFFSGLDKSIMTKGAKLPVSSGGIFLAGGLAS